MEGLMPESGNQRRVLVSKSKLITSMKCSLIDKYIYFGKPRTNQSSQQRATDVYQHIVKMLLNDRSTLPFNWEEHALVARSILIGTGFDPHHLIIIQFVNENTEVKKTMTLYSSVNHEIFNNIPADFNSFCEKLFEICKKTASSQPKQNKPSPMVALFIYSPSYHEVLNLVEMGIIEIKLALTNLLCKLGIMMKDDKSCKVQAFDPFWIFPDEEFVKRHGFRGLVNEYKQKLKSWIVTDDENEALIAQINITKAFDRDFCRIAEKFALKYLPEREKNDDRMLRIMSRYTYNYEYGEE